MHLVTKSASLTYASSQIYNARRFNVDMAQYPHFLEIEQALAEIPAFANAHPDKQPDAVLRRSGSRPSTHRGLHAGGRVEQRSNDRSPTCHHLISGSTFIKSGAIIGQMQMAESPI